MELRARVCQIMDNLILDYSPERRLLYFYYRDGCPDLCHFIRVSPIEFGNQGLNLNQGRFGRSRTFFSNIFKNPGRIVSYSLNFLRRFTLFLSERLGKPRSLLLSILRVVLGESSILSLIKLREGITDERRNYHHSNADQSTNGYWIHSLRLLIQDYSLGSTAAVASGSCIHYLDSCDPGRLWRFGRWKLQRIQLAIEPLAARFDQYPLPLADSVHEPVKLVADRFLFGQMQISILLEEFVANDAAAAGLELLA
jgi:hypothetical protein